MVSTPYFISAEMPDWSTVSLSWNCRKKGSSAYSCRARPSVKRCFGRAFSVSTFFSTLTSISSLSTPGKSATTTSPFSVSNMSTGGVSVRVSSRVSGTFFSTLAGTVDSFMVVISSQGYPRVCCQLTFTSICFGFASARFGSVNSSRPFLYSAVTLSPSTSAGSGMTRVNRPAPRSLR
ncbi:MAG: hypothetical protein BWX80_04093 [Candidatus Hydrogenedentes bacterium ADurb.Bin101]|nr:MAG: hypothetical protein BWX80_04093 [Candidatus Hydrogenedentes bacterium ADurb.Bin101]